MNGWIESEMMLKCAKTHRNWFRHFADAGERYEPSDVVAWNLILAHPVRLQKYPSLTTTVMHYGWV